jgi:hypothetical protein
MKTLLIIACLLFAVPALAERVTWDPPTTYTDGSAILAADLQGYNLYETTGGIRAKVNSGLITHSTQCVGTVSPKCSWTLPEAQSKGDTFVLTAVDSLGQESGDSNVATFAGKKLGVPGILVIQ